MCSPIITTVEAFREHFNDVVESHQKNALFVRAIELQRESVTAFEALLAQCRLNKESAIQGLENDAANAFLAFEYMAEALINELRFYIELKQDNVDRAWDRLVEAESAAANAMKAHAVASHLKRYINRLHAMEHLLFPKPAFISSGWIIRASECSICREPYGDCNHVKGRPYMGQLCARVITDGTVQEFSIVEEPADKHCRVMHFGERGIWRNAFTHRVVPEEAVNPTPTPPDPII